MDLKTLSTIPMPNSNKIFPITLTGVERTWKTTKETCQKLIDSNNLIAETENENIIIYEKLREDQVLKTHWIDKKYHAYHFGTKLLDNLLGVKTFDFPKSLFLIIDLLKITLGKNDLVLDFFSGSATTAHATMKLNAEDGGNRKYIMVQLPEIIEEKSEAYKAGYRTISEVGQERIRKAGDEILEEHPEIVNNLDIGFKVLKLDKSNIRQWNVDFEDIENTLETYQDVFVLGRSELDVVYEIMLKYGLELTYPISTFQVDGKNIYDIAYGNLFICLNEQIDSTIAQGIIDKRNEYGIETSTVVLADSGFNGNDSEKLNCFKLLQDAGYQDEQLLTI